MNQNISSNVPFMESLQVIGYDFQLISENNSFPTYLWQMVHFSPRIRSLILQDPCIRSYTFPFPAKQEDVLALLNYISTNQIEINQENCYFMWRSACEFESLPLLYTVKNFIFPLLNPQNIFQYFVSNSPPWTIPPILEFFATYPVYIDSLIQNGVSADILEQIFLLCSQNHTFPSQNMAVYISHLIQRDGLLNSYLFSTIDFSQLSSKDISFITKNILKFDISGSLWFSLKAYMKTNNYTQQNQPQQVFQQIPQQNVLQQQQQQTIQSEQQQNQYQQQQQQIQQQPLQQSSATAQYQANISQVIQSSPNSSQENFQQNPQVIQPPQQQIQQTVNQPEQQVIPTPNLPPHPSAVPKPSSSQSIAQQVPKPVSTAQTSVENNNSNDDDETEDEEEDEEEEENESDDENNEEEEEEEEIGDFEVDPGDFPYDPEEPLQGIFYHMAQCIGSPVLYGLCSMTGGGGRGRSLKYLIDMNDHQRWWCNKSGRETRWEDAWFTIKFLKHTVKLTNYTLYCLIGSPFCAQPKSWKLWAANLDRGEDWVLLDEQKNVKGMNCKNATMTFPIPKKRQDVYTDYKIVCTENFTKHEDGKFFLTKIEFFGSLLYQ